MYYNSINEIQINVDACNIIKIYHDLFLEVEKLRTIASKLTESDPTDNDILDYYDIILNIRNHLKNN